tara:strand:+ start:16729 stop:17079 length:351 start_codon:yes stop_codon:yes gene_type:complete
MGFLFNKVRRQYQFEYEECEKMKVIMDMGGEVNATLHNDLNDSRHKIRSLMNQIEQLKLVNEKFIEKVKTLKQETRKKELTDLKKSELKDMCRDIGLLVSGNKKVLVDRIRTACCN